MPQFVDLETAVKCIRDNDVVVTSGFVGCGNPESLEVALEERFLKENAPRDLTLCYVAGQGDGVDKSVNHLAHEGLLKRIIAAHFNKAPKIMDMMVNNKIEAYNVPQGAMAHMLRDSAAHKPGVFTKIGIGTFADPRLEGSKVNEITTKDIVKLMEIEGEEWLFYPRIDFDIAIIKGSYADEKGNVTMQDECLPTEVLSMAEAVHNNGGKVIVQVNKVVKSGSLDPKLVKVPGVMVDLIVEVQEDQAYGIKYEPELAGNAIVAEGSFDPYIPLNEKKIIARRGAMEIKKGTVGNLGIGAPEYVSNVANEEGIGDYMTLTVEAGAIGGIPQSGAKFGAAINADCYVDQPYQFDFYDGGGLDICYLGLAQADEQGNLNVSKFGTRVAGCGGFISISTCSKKVIFCGTFTTKGLKIEAKDGKLHILEEGKMKKFVKNVQQITFSGEQARKNKQPVMYITERCVFEMRPEGLTLTEIAPGIDLEKDILGQMDFKPIIAKDLKEMDARIFYDKPMGLK